MREASGRQNALLCMLLAAGLPGCSLLEPEPLEPPVVNLVALQPEAYGLNRQAFRARLKLFNPNPIPLKVSKSELELALNGVHAATGRTLEPFSIAPGASGEVDIRITTNLLRDAPTLFRSLSDGSAGEGLQYRLDGHVEVERRGRDRMPIEASGRLTVPGFDPGAGRAAPDTTL